ncbi:phosphotransferase enzyme family-domain-containing protein [Apodospora peruviana]|uniref:Phosphotransferase enzyme family-domain-containing protein n=1 Tax=Apodospora peruviana TaxID=516989 RepID=A0AAE0I843_9PEZI|nr:phosphotransferase enzyme family-domain-containing protein [Apodospora peruviana]
MRNKASRDGLVWDDTGFDLEPRWAREPPDLESLERLCRRELGLGRTDNCTVSLHAAGTYNKNYLVETAGDKFILRVSLPVDPHNKTRGEVATLQLVRRKTDIIPVPEVIAFDGTSDNDIGFEWILMEWMAGKPAYYRWRKMSMTKKERLVARVADFQAQLWQHGNNLGDVGLLRGIGTLGTSQPTDQNDVDDMDGMPCPGQIVSAAFFSGAHYDYHIPRGPFVSSHDWLQVYLNIIVKEHTTSLAETKDQDDREYAEGALRVARKLLRLLHRVFPSLLHPPERTMLWHDDLSLMNIMVDDNDEITAIIDWECVSAMPVWVSSQLPEFLRGADREKRPDRNRYTDVSDQHDTSSNDGQMEDSLDNEGKTELYWIHLMEYEQTQLRKVYAARMRELRPSWDMEVTEGALKADFLGAVTRCGAGFYLRRIEQWVDAIERREFVGLMEVLRVGLRKDKTATGRSVVAPIKW